MSNFGNRIEVLFENIVKGFEKSQESKQNAIGAINEHPDKFLKFLCGLIADSILAFPGMIVNLEEDAKELFDKIKEHLTADGSLEPEAS